MSQQRVNHMIHYTGKRKPHHQHLGSHCELFKVLEYPNNVFVSFDPFGFLVNYFRTEIPLMRCDSLGDLYLVTASYPFAGLAYNLWHSRLGHPSSSPLQSLHSDKFISYKPLKSRITCASCDAI